MISFLQKFARISFLALLCSLFVFGGTVFAGPPGSGPLPGVPPGSTVDTDVEARGAGVTVLPETALPEADCEILMNYVQREVEESKEVVASRNKKTIAEYGKSLELSESNILGCGIKTGTIKLWMVPFYIRFLLQFVIGIAGLAAVGGIIYGGFTYLFAGLSDDKEKGKKAILYGIVGFVMTLVAWVVVNVVMALFS